jgi:pyruvate formate lyase activating enzyme
MRVLPAMSRGIVFDVREFTVHDGPGIRTTVFMKGCPLRCTWCHNPEGLDMKPSVMRSPSGERTVGRDYEAVELAGILSGQADILAMNGGGLTFSGGEPLLQARFVAEVVDLLGDMHIVLDTAGFAETIDFVEVVRRVDLVLFDLKLIDPLAHRRWTGQDNGPILRNLALLEELGRPFVARIPLVPGVTDTEENLSAIAETLASTPTLIEAQLLPYNRAAGGKYAACGMTFRPRFDEDQTPNVDTGPFRRAGIEVRVA